MVRSGREFDPDDGGVLGQRTRISTSLSVTSYQGRHKILMLKHCTNTGSAFTTAHVFIPIYVAQQDRT